MTNYQRWEWFTYTGAAKVLGVAVWRLRYAVDSGYVARPGVRIKRREYFTPSQIDWLRAYFAGVGTKEGEVAGKNNGST